MRLRRVLSAVDSLSDWSGKIISYLILIIMLCVTYDVILRYIFNAPTLWAFDIVQFLFGALAILSGAYALRWKAHVNIDVIYGRFSLRQRAIIDLVTSFLFFSFIAVLFWWGIGFAARSIGFREVTQTIFHAPIYPVKITMPLAAFLLLLQGLADFTRNMVTAITGRQAT